MAEGIQCFDWTASVFDLCWGC